jgi:hypothetical protein
VTTERRTCDDPGRPASILRAAFGHEVGTQGDAFLLALAGRVTRSEQRRGGQHAFEAITGRPSLGGIGGFRSHRLYDEVLDRLRQGLMDADRIDQLPV